MTTNVKVVPATPYHALDLGYRLRAADRSEIKASSGFCPEDALAGSMLHSRRCWAAVINGRCEAIFGVSPWPLAPAIGSPWLLASEEFDKHRRALLRHTRQYVAECEAEFPLLANYVDARHDKSIRWLLWAGFEITGIDTEYGVERRPFYRFSKVRSNV